MSCFTGAGYTENKISMLLTPGDFAEHVTETSWMLKRGVPMKKFTKKEIFAIYILQQKVKENICMQPL